MVVYCVKCKQKRGVLNPKIETTKNGRKILKGTCEVCHSKVSSFVKNTTGGAIPPPQNQQSNSSGLGDLLGDALDFLPELLL